MVGTAEAAGVLGPGTVAAPAKEVEAPATVPQVAAKVAGAMVGLTIKVPGTVTVPATAVREEAVLTPEAPQAVEA